MRGKNKCKLLKQIRQRIADENDIPFVTQECGYRGESAAVPARSASRSCAIWSSSLHRGRHWANGSR